MRDRSPGPDQLVPNLSGERKVSQAVIAVVDVADLPTAKPVDGCWWNPKPALARTSPSRLLAYSGPAQDLALDRSQKFVVHSDPPRAMPGGDWQGPEKEPSMPVLLRGLPVHDHAQSDTEKGFAHRAKARFVTCTFVRFTRSPFVPITQLRHVAMPHSDASCWMVLVRLNGRETKSGETRAVFGADGRRFSP
jgi:hypothetical protein